MRRAGWGWKPRERLPGAGTCAKTGAAATAKARIKASEGVFMAFSTPAPEVADVATVSAADRGSALVRRIPRPLFVKPS